MMHDSLVYEVPDEKVKAFVQAVRPVLSKRPRWSTIDVKIDVEAGKRLGSLKTLK